MKNKDKLKEMRGHLRAMLSISRDWKTGNRRYLIRYQNTVTYRCTMDEVLEDIVCKDMPILYIADRKEKIAFRFLNKKGLEILDYCMAEMETSWKDEEGK